MHSYKFVATSKGFSVLNNGSETPVINQNGSLNGSLVIDSSVTTAKLANHAVTSAKIADSSVTSAKIADSSVTSAKIADSSVTTAKLANHAVTSAKLDETTIQYAEVTISSDNITGTEVGQLGHSGGVVLVADPGATKVVELISAVLIYDYATAAYTDGGNLTININGGNALTGAVAKADSIGASTDKIVQFVPLATAGIVLTANKGLNLVAATAFTQPGDAAGVVRVKVAYRVHTHGLA